MGRRIIVSVINDLVTDQRVHKVCSGLSKRGYEVTLVGRLLNGSMPIDRPYKTVRMRLLFNNSALFYAEYNLRLLIFLLTHRCHIQLANDTDTLSANYISAALLKRKLVFDAHEFFPESTEIIHKPLVKKVWRTIEDMILPHVRYSYTVCESIALIYRERYGMDMKVVRNSPVTLPEVPLQSEDPRLSLVRSLKESGRKIILYQGVLNIGRGIEWVIDAMRHLTDATFCIIGDGNITKELRERIEEKGVEDRVVMLGKVEPSQLPSFTRMADIGVNLLAERGLNQYYALPNRVFDFIHAEVPTLSTDFPEIRRVYDRYNVGHLTLDYAPEQLATSLEELLKEWEHKPNRKEIFAQAKKELCWEVEEEMLFGVFNELEA